MTIKIRIFNVTIGISFFVNYMENINIDFKVKNNKNLKVKKKNSNFV